ncbi:putative LRR receptor-like serine/threonine-protein kinase RKF3 [Capsicum baccatum]|uniref:LRR receptor-like serine/threonine-protein kinase RKF3 n=1 Tax=Capsicum baccatum TaxID=33114 RepID=A0A2G2VYP9_CAPBA|nr:putative LRR receptor-like serine/threonine-protein kinase RKF3 [Capsicum baccatum]
MGYVAHEFALYVQFTERSDFYSFGVVLLELLSGNKAIIEFKDRQPNLVTYWAWSLVREGRALDVLEDNILHLGPPEFMEKYVLVVVLCSHPQLYVRPIMDQVVNMLETEIPVPTILERPISLIADLGDIERSVGSSGGSAKEATAAAAAEKKSPRSLTTIPSEASNVSRDVTSHPARPMFDGQKCSAGYNKDVFKQRKIIMDLNLVEYLAQSLTTRKSEIDLEQHQEKISLDPKLQGRQSAIPEQHGKKIS